MIEYNKEATDALYFYHKLLLGESIKFQSSLTEVNFQKNNHSNVVTYLFLILPPQPWFNSKNSIMLINASYYGEPICHDYIPRGYSLICRPKGFGFCGDSV